MKKINIIPIAFLFFIHSIASWSNDEAMFLRGLSAERSPTADMPNRWDTSFLVDINSYIINAGDLVRTDFLRGNTEYSTIDQGISKVRSESFFKPQVIKKISQYQRIITDDRGEFYSQSSDDLNEIDLKNRIKKSKPAHIILVGRYSKKNSIESKFKCLKNGRIPFCTMEQIEKTTYQRLDGHFLVINGFDGKYFKIYDPWGRIYNVSMNVETLDIERDVAEPTRPEMVSNVSAPHAVGASKKPFKSTYVNSMTGPLPVDVVRKNILNFKHVDGEQGFAFRYQDSNKLLVENVLGWSLLKGAPESRTETRNLRDNTFDLPDLTGSQWTDPNAGLGSSLPSYQHLDNFHLGNKNPVLKLDPASPKRGR